MPSILSWDIETAGLRADWDAQLVFGYKWLGQGAKTKTILDFPHDDIIDDRGIVGYAHSVLSQADMFVTYYGKGFDLKFMNAKFLQYGLPVLPPIPHVDLYFIVRGNLALSRKSLDNVVNFLDLGQKKYHVSPQIWRKARIGDPAAIKQVAAHCKRDVELTEDLYLKLRPLSRQHPRVAGWSPCRVCGSERLQRRGYAMTSTMGRKVRVQCQSCSAWENRSIEHAEVAA